MGNLSKLKTCNNNFEAQLLKGALKSEGIVCMLSNENMTNLYGGMISAFSGVDVMVLDADYDAAKKIMTRAEKSMDEKTKAQDESMKDLEWSFG
jgi:hypothetical protein